MTTVQEQIREVEREISRRKKQYPRAVQNGDVTRVEADRCIKIMEDVKKSLLLMPKEVSLLGI